MQFSSWVSVLGSHVTGMNHTEVRILVLLTTVNMLQNVVITIIIINSISIILSGDI
jgi:hypothetical protein